MKLIDTHAHIYDRAFDGDREEAIRNACGAGVGIILMPAIDSQSHGAMFETARANPQVCLPMMGLHPTSVNDNPKWKEELELVKNYLAEPPSGITEFYAVGEVGLDLYWSREWEKEQTEAFETQIELALAHDLPLVIHTREAWPQMLETLSRFRGRGLKGVMHAFSGEYGHYAKIRDLGDFMFGAGGVATYKNSGAADVIKRMDINHIVLETDCPYLTPVPLRGKRNEPRYLIHILVKIAEIHGMTIEEAARVTTQNARKMFGI